MLRRFLSILLAALMIVGCASAAGREIPKVVRYDTADNGECIVNDVVFHGDGASQGNDRVMYEIFVGSFSDSNGDGIGDLRGIINRLDLLNDGDPTSGQSLGVEGLWLTPIFLSPSYHKYDVTDFLTIDPSFGTMEDLRELVQACHDRGMILILDLPINHTAKNCSWFTQFTNAHIVRNPENRWYDWYTWIGAEETKPAGRSFTRLQGTKILYESNFSDSMPELNYDLPQVRQTVLDIARYYLELGVDGFRFDAAKYVYFGDHTASMAFWQWYTDELRAIKPDVYLIGEVWDSDGITDLYAPAMSCFNFTASQTDGLIASTAKGGDAGRLMSYIAQRQSDLSAISGDARLSLFVANHDTDRAAGYLTQASGRMAMAANLYLLAPGSPFIYYGEEIALRGSRGSANTDANRRLAMVWGDGDTVADPVGTTYDPSKQTPYTVSDQIGKSDSMWTYYKRLLMIRRANPEIAAGTATALTIPDSKLGGLICEQDGSRVLVLHNPTTRSITCDLSQYTGLSFTTLSAVIGAGNATLEGTVITLAGQTSAVLR